MQNETLEQWLTDLAAKQPTPGGGAAAALFAATAAALAGMVASYTTGPKWQDRSARMAAIADAAGQLRQAAVKTMAADARAFAAVGAAYALPHGSEDEKTARQAAIQAALQSAAGPPCQVVDTTRRLLPLLEELAAAGNPNVMSDVAVAASAARAALEGAIVNIEINERSIADKSVAAGLQQTVKAAASDIETTAAIVQKVRKGLQG